MTPGSNEQDPKVLQTNAQFAAITRQARRSQQDRAALLDRALTAAAGGNLDPAAWQEARDVAHQLVGAAGTFGYPRVSELARDLEQFFAEASSDHQAVQGAWDLLAALIKELDAPPAELDDEN